MQRLQFLATVGREDDWLTIQTSFYKVYLQQTWFFFHTYLPLSNPVISGQKACSFWRVVFFFCQILLTTLNPTISKEENNPLSLQRVTLRWVPTPSSPPFHDVPSYFTALSDTGGMLPILDLTGLITIVFSQFKRLIYIIIVLCYTPRVLYCGSSRGTIVEHPNTRPPQIHRWVASGCDWPLGIHDDILIWKIFGHGRPQPVQTSSQRSPTVLSSCLF
ncbi:hypothetical protein L873DRAFT_608691 [Choiromyces venosus 120613-1]|uniref:Uncharacterized protein n=1 Tax=Choiromyces venosus 120613-1 TaxID=1336337 RepID=A0A3N4K0C1_9PEZI|nr:hypothetical protein L873DRAFT_608691 [Choiromyces venosus 120613-1]